MRITFHEVCDNVLFMVIQNKMVFFFFLSSLRPNVNSLCQWLKLIELLGVHHFLVFCDILHCFPSKLDISMHCNLGSRVGKLSLE